LLHQTLYRQTRQLFQAVQIFEGGGKGMETAFFKEVFYPQFDARGIQHVLPFVAVNLCRRCQAVAALVLVHQRVDIHHR
jgi:hypothetical protein